MSDPLREALWERTLLPTPAGIQAAELLDRCQSALPAELVLRQAARAAAASGGPTSPGHCAIQCELGELYAQMGDPQRALSAWRAAAAVLGGEEVERDRLTFRLLLARQLGLTGDEAAAETMLRDDLEARRAFYGPEHPATALLLRELAELLLRRGRVEEALELADEALELLVEGEEPGEVLPTLALRLECSAAAGEPPFEADELAGLDPEVAEELAMLVVERAGEAPPARAAALLREVGAALTDALGREHPARVTLLAGWPDTVSARERLEPLRELIAHTERRGQRLGTASARTALARALEEAGQPDEAARVLQDAVARARTLRDRATRARAVARTRRAEGELARRRGQPAPARAALEEALAQARQAEPELTGPTLCALGEVLAALGDPGARAALEEGLTLLPLAHPAALEARAALARLTGAPDPAAAARAELLELLASQARDEVASEGLVAEGVDLPALSLRHARLQLGLPVE